MRIAFIAVLILGASVSFGQQNNLDEKYEPKNNSSLQENSISNKKTELKNYKAAFKLNPTLAFRKVFAAGIEYSPSEIVSLEGTLGYCAGVDPVMRIASAYIMDEGAILGGDGVGLPSLFAAQGSNQYGGLFFQGEAKFYLFGEDYFDGMYCGFAIRKSSFGFDLNKSLLRAETGYEIAPGSLLRVDVSNVGYYGTYGVSFKSGNKDQIVHQLYMGMGFRFSKYTAFIQDDPTYNYSGGYSTQNDPYLRRTGFLNKTMDFSVFAGYCLGFGI